MAEAAGARVVVGGYVAGTKGHLGLTAIQVVDGYDSTETIACDGLAMANGWNPVVHLDSHLSRKPVWNEAIHAFVPGTLPSGMRAVGAAAGLFHPLRLSGERGAGRAEAATECGFSAVAEPAPRPIPRARGTLRCGGCLDRRARLSPTSKTMWRPPTSNSPTARVSAPWSC